MEPARQTLWEQFPGNCVRRKQRSRIPFTRPFLTWRTHLPMTRPSIPTVAPDLLVPEQRSLPINRRPCMPGVQGRKLQTPRLRIFTVWHRLAAASRGLLCQLFSDTKKSPNMGARRAHPSARSEAPPPASFLSVQSGTLSAGTGRRNDAIGRDVTWGRFCSRFKCTYFSAHGGCHAE